MNGRTADTPKKYYAVQKGGRPGVYEDWPSTQAAKPKLHKSFLTREEAEAFVKEGRASAYNGIKLLNQSVGTGAGTTSNSPIGIKAEISAAKKLKKNDGLAEATLTLESYEPGEGPLPPDAEDGFDPRIKLNPDTGELAYKEEAEQKAQKLQATGKSHGPMLVWTDGSSRGNGQIGARAGIGVFFGVDDPR